MKLDAANGNSTHSLDGTDHSHHDRIHSASPSAMSMDGQSDKEGHVPHLICMFRHSIFSISRSFETPVLTSIL